MDLLSAVKANPTSIRLQAMKVLSERSLLGFVRSFWHVLEPGRRLVLGRPLEVIAEHLEAVTDGRIKKLAINVPPGFMKSLLVNVFWPAWEWGPASRPWLRYVSFSYSADITVRDNVKMKRLITSPEYNALWGNAVFLTDDVHGKERFDNTKTGSRLATSVNGASTGERGDRVIVDDPNKVKEAESDAVLSSTQLFMTETLPSRVNDPDESAFVLIQQRVSERDATAAVLESKTGWNHLVLPMEFEENHPFPSQTNLHFHDWRTTDGELLWPERYSKRYIEDELKPALQSVGGDFAVAGQLQQRPAPRGGGIFPKDWPIVDSLPSGRVIARVRGWDLASTKKKRSPYTVGVKMCAIGKNIYIEHVLRFRDGPQHVRRRIVETAHADGSNVVVDIPQDPGQAGNHQVQDYVAHLHGFIIRWSQESGDKETRAIPFSAQVLAGNVYLVNGPWVPDYLKEARSFPRSATKDQIDATSRAYMRLCAMMKQSSVSTNAPQVIEG